MRIREVKNDTFGSVRLYEKSNNSVFKPMEFFVEGFPPLSINIHKREVNKLISDEKLMTIFLAREIFGSLNSPEFKQFLKAKVKNTGVNIMKKSCTDERPCINCYADQGPCLGKHIDNASFEQAAEPLMKWLSENVHPHHTVIVSANTAELLEGTRCHNTDKYLVD